VYSLGKAKITGIASVWGVAGVNKRRSELNTDDVTGLSNALFIFHPKPDNHKIVVRIENSSLPVHSQFTEDSGLNNP
jgi:hypothetical protein